MSMARIYRVIVRVEVQDDWPEDPDNYLKVTYAAYEAAREALNANTADWYAEEEETF